MLPLSSRTYTIIKCYVYWLRRGPCSIICLLIMLLVIRPVFTYVDYPHLHIIKFYVFYPLVQSYCIRNYRHKQAFCISGFLRYCDNNMLYSYIQRIENKLSILRTLIFFTFVFEYEGSFFVPYSNIFSEPTYEVCRYTFYMCFVDS